VTSKYFEVMGIPLLAGRGFEPTDRFGGPPVVLVNRLLADAVFGGRAIGQRVRFPFTGPTPLEIVGVVDNEQFADIDQPVRPVLYFPYDQGPTGVMSVVLRTATEPGPLVPSVRAAMASLDPGLPLYAVATMDEILGSSSPVFRRRAVLFLLAGFAVTALLLAAVGLYGVLSQIVAQRTKEIGIRLALGATSRAIVAAIVRPGVVAVGSGIAAGLACCFVAGRLLGSLLFQTGAIDVAALIAVVMALVLAAVAASVVPSRRALRIDPVESLRE
jgi:putative ABC transport system permease protein